MGTNELLVHRVALFNEFDDIFEIIFNGAITALKNKNKYNDNVKDYINELKNFIFLRKKELLMILKQRRTLNFITTSLQFMINTILLIQTL